MFKIIFNSILFMFKAIIVASFSLLAISGFSQGNTQEKVVTFSFYNLSIKEALLQVQDEMGISMVFNNSLEELDEKITGTYTSQTISYILGDIFKNTNLLYKVIGDRIVIYLKRDKNDHITISGYVKDLETGEALIGCTVYEKNTFNY